MPAILLREAIEYHDVADTINGQFRTCMPWCGRASEPLTRKDLEPALPYQSCKPAVGAAEFESLQALLTLETLRPKKPLHDVDHLGNVGRRGHLAT